MSEEVKAAEVSEQVEVDEKSQVAGSLDEAKAEGIVHLSEEAEKAQAKEDMKQRRERLLKGLNRADRRKNVTREDLILILDQFSENMSQISNGLMSDVNALYSHHVFPALMWIDVFKAILIEAKLTTEDDLIVRFNGRIKELQKKALEAAKEKEKQEAIAKAEAEKAQNAFQEEQKEVEHEAESVSEDLPEEEDVGNDAEAVDEIEQAEEESSDEEAPVSEERKAEVSESAHVEGRKLVV